MSNAQDLNGTVRLNERRDKSNYYLDIAEAISARGTCLRRNYGSIIVKNDEIIATGYVGAPRGTRNCTDIGHCLRDRMNIPRGQMYERCRSVHSEANAIISSARRDMIGATLYLAGRDKKTGDLISRADSCAMCKRLIINAGIQSVIIRESKDDYRTISVSDWISNYDLLSEQPGY